MELLTWTLVSLYSLRLLLTCLPQTGYLHPDEFFQSVEVTTGDILNVEGVRTWEFNANAPIRSSVMVHGMTGLPLYLLQLANFYMGTLITPYLVLVMPRIFVTVLSFVNDYVIWKLSKKFGLQTTLCMLIFASSYVTLIFYTRTLSNTTEALVFNLILLFTTSDQKISSRGDKCDEDDENETLGTMPYQITVSSTWIGVLISVGFFNRPTFLIFAFVPILLWMLKSFSVLVFVVRSIYLVVGFIISSVVIICLDTVYYKHNFGDIELDFQYCFQKAPNVYGCVKETILEHFVVSPWNFVKYNTNTANLESHGAHPWYLHLTANSLILFGPLAVLAVITCIGQLKGFLSWKGGRIGSLVCMFYFPVLMLSLFPHQEPRFIIPLLTPVVLLTSKYFRGNSQPARYLTVAWTIFNIFGVVLFGFVHQGGVVQSLFDLNSRLGIGPLKPFLSPTLKTTGVMDVIYSGTYMPPEHLLLRQKSPKIFGSDYDLNMLNIPVIKIHDLKGADDSVVTDYITSLKFSRLKMKENANIYVVASLSRVSKLCDSFSFQKVASFFPHISMEDPPAFGQMFSLSNDKTRPQCFLKEDQNSLWKVAKNHLSLFVLKLT